MSDDVTRVRAVHQVYLGIDTIVQPDDEFDCPNEVLESLKANGAVALIEDEEEPSASDVI